MRTPKAGPVIPPEIKQAMDKFADMSQEERNACIAETRPDMNDPQSVPMTTTAPELVAR